MFLIFISSFSCQYLFYTLKCSSVGYINNFIELTTLVLCNDLLFSCNHFWPKVYLVSYIFLHLFIFSFWMSLMLKLITLKQKIIESCIFIYSASTYLLIKNLTYKFKFISDDEELIIAIFKNMLRLFFCSLVLFTSIFLHDLITFLW